MGGDQHVIRADWLPPARECPTHRGVVPVDRRLERQDLERGQDSVGSVRELGRARFLSAEAQLRGHRTAMHLSNSTPDEAYWRVRRQVILRHTGELPLEVRGPDAARMLDHVFTRDISSMKVDRCSYQFACYDAGGMITDGVLMRLAPDRFWFGQADGDLFSWLKASARGFDPDDYPERFRYFDIATVRIAGQPVNPSRTGFTNELGWESNLTSHRKSQGRTPK